MSAISFHDTLHRFWAGQGIWTATLEAKLLQQLSAMREAVIFKVFLDLCKAYDALYQEISIDLLSAYGVGTRTVRLIWT